LNGEQAFFIGDRSLSFEAVPVCCVLGEVLMPQRAFVRKLITVVNLFYFRFFESNRKMNKARAALIFLLTRGGNHNGKV
jgi:hypothetical protein